MSDAERDLEKLEQERIRKKGLKDYYDLRNRWSTIVAVLLFFTFFFQLGLVIVVGLKWMDFKDHPWFLRIVAGQNFAQIIALCIIVVRFLFPREQADQNTASGSKNSPGS